MRTLDLLLAAVVAEPRDESCCLVLADYLDEFDDPRRGELLRLHRRLVATCCEPDAHPDRVAWQGRVTELLAAGVRPCVPHRTIVPAGGVPLTFAFVPPGEFLMGSDDPDDFADAPRRASVAGGLFVGTHPVTQGQWCSVMGTDPLREAQQRHPAVNQQLPVPPTPPGWPVEPVTWDAAQEFAGRVAAADRPVRLLTEIEWEYACRAGTTTPYHTGDGRAALDITGWYRDHPLAESCDWRPGVGVLAPNPWGLFDMHGLVWEWCADPWGPLTDRQRVTRGGCASYSERSCRSGRRGAAPEDGYDSYTSGSEIGFRVCFPALPPD